MEAVHLLKGFSQWMVSIGMAIIAFIGSTYFKHPEGSLWIPAAAVVSFAIAILAATWVVGALPWIAINIEDPKFKNPYMAPVTDWPYFWIDRIKMWQVVTLEHLAFAIGIVFLGIAVCFQHDFGVTPAH
jgi:hypothetical protein